MRIKTKLVHYTIILFDGLESVVEPWKLFLYSSYRIGCNSLILLMYLCLRTKIPLNQGPMVVVIIQLKVVRVMQTRLPANGERPSEVIPDDLQVQMADCSHLSFGSFGFGMSYVFSSGPSASMPVNSNLEEDHRDSDVSSVEHSNTRYSALRILS